MKENIAERFTEHKPITSIIPVGIENAVSLSHIAIQARIDREYAKELIRRARRDNVIIYSPNIGYWLPKNPPTEEDKKATTEMVNREEKQALSRFVTMKFAKQWLKMDENQTCLDFERNNNNGE